MTEPNMPRVSKKEDTHTNRPQLLAAGQADASQRWDGDTEESQIPFEHQGASDYIRPA